MTFSKKTQQTIQPSTTELRFYHSAQQIPVAEWNDATNSNNVFTSLPYLLALEQAGTTGLVHRYAIIKHKKKSVGVMCFQLLDVAARSVDGLINFEDKGWLLKKLSTHINRLLFSGKNGKPNYIVCCGSFLASGEHGISFSSKENQHLIISSIPKAIAHLKNEIEKTANVCAWVVKDFFDISYADHLLTENKFINVPMDSEMIFYPQTGWKNFNDYINALSAKYRLRANNVLKKIKGLEIKQLTEKEIEAHITQLETLYNNVQQKAIVRLVRVNAQYFIQLKKQLAEQFYVTAFFKEGKMIAFISGLVYKGFHEAHFIGIDYTYNKALQLYQNILYRFIQDAVEKKSCCLYFGRTAMEIKSTVGARAYPLYTYVKLNNPFLNKMMHHFSHRLKAEEWIERRPFKEN